MNSDHKVISTLVKSGATLLLCLLFLQVLIGGAAVAAPGQQAGPDDANVADDTAKAAAVGTTFNVTSPDCVGPNTLYEAILSANTTQGTDTINILTSRISLCKVDLAARYWTNVTESLNIIGNGVTVDGAQRFLTADGRRNPLVCPQNTSDTVVLNAAPGFLEIGTFSGGGSGIAVNITGVNVANAPYLFEIRSGASLVVENATFTEIRDYEKDCNQPPVIVESQSSFVLRNSRILGTWNDWPILSSGFGQGVIQSQRGAGASITIENSVFTVIRAGFAVRNDTGDTNIVSSQFSNAGGFYNGSGTMKIVNTAWHSDIATGEDNPYYQFQQVNSGGAMLLEATTVSVGAPYCRVVTPNAVCTNLKANPTGASVMPFNVAGGTLDLKATAIGGPDFPDASAVIYKAAGATVTADANTWIQPRAVQDANDLESITGQPGLLTDPPGLPADPFAIYPGAVTPLLGTSGTPGVLLDVIPNATCTSPNDANKLINPIDNSCIDKDVLGNDRWDTGNNKRNIGAVQLTLAPHLTVKGTGDGFVDLGWSRPQDPDSGAITGYKIYYCIGCPDPFTGTEVSIAGADTLTTTISPLFNGLTYVFRMVAVNNSGDGPPSNRVLAVPLGDISPPGVTATPGNSQVTLSWTEPNAAGHPGPLTYSVLYRQVGAQSWQSGPTGLTTLSATIASLTNGTEYEFYVIATADDGISGPPGTDTATPVGPGVVVIRKISLPAGGTGFGFTGDLGSFTLNDSGSKTVVDLAPGTYTVTENDPLGLGYELSGLSCSDSDTGGTPSTGDVATRTATVHLDHDETVTCTFTNTEDDTVTVEKLTIPPSGDSFGFGGTLGNFNLTAGNVKDFTNVTPGTYTISENDPAPAGYALTDITCVDSATGQTFPGNLNTRSVDLNLVAGERVHCTFTNTKLGTIIIKKATAPAGGSGFSFSGDLGTFNLDDGGNQTISNVAPGSYSVTEADPSGSGYELSGLTCVDSDASGQPSAGDVASRTATINLDAGETVTCTFINAEDDTVTVEKVTIPPSGDSFGFGGTLGNFNLTAGNVKDFTNVTPGAYTISEDDPAPAGYALTDISCVDSATGQTFSGNVSTRSVNLNLVAGERVHCIFINTKAPSYLYFPIIVN